MRRIAIVYLSRDRRIISNRRLLVRIRHSFAATCSLVWATLACSSTEPLPAPASWQSFAGNNVTVEYQVPDAARSAGLHTDAIVGRASVEAFFQRELGAPITVRVYPDRQSLVAYWRSAWNQPSLEPECWMIASADDRLAVILAPRLWSTAACGHNGSDAEHVRRVVAHEIVHILHRRANGAPGFVAPNLWWFVEGAAVLGSGQLDAAARSRVRALVTDYSPATPQSALSGPSGYDVVGSMAHYIDQRYGRASLADLLTARNEGELFERLGTSSAQFLADWRAFVLQ
jgi:hypothetical protein